MERHQTVAAAMAALNEPYDPIKIVQDLLDHAVYDAAKTDECADAVENAIAFLVQEGCK